MEILISQNKPRNFNQALMDLGSDIEAPLNPHSEDSPVKSSVQPIYMELWINLLKPLKEADFGLSAGQCNKRGLILGRKE